MSSKQVADMIQEVTTSVIAIGVIAGVFVLGFLQMYRNEPISIPDVYSLLVGAVAGTYFGKVLAVNGARQAGTAAAQAAQAAAAAAVQPTPNAGG